MRPPPPQERRPPRSACPPRPASARRHCSRACDARRDGRAGRLRAGCGPQPCAAPPRRIERHKGAAYGPQGMGDGERPDAAAILWNAAADAMAWAAFIREHASWAELRGAWAAKSEAVDAMRIGTEECGRIVDAQGTVDAAAVGRASEAMRHAAATVGRAGEAFGRSSDLCMAAGAGQRRAGEAYALASNPECGADMCGMAARSYNRSVGAAEMAANARGIAAGLAQEAGEMDSLAASWKESGRAWRGDRGGLAAVQADMWEDAKEMRANAAEMQRSAERAEQATARMRAVAAREAERSASLAAAAVRAGAGPGAQEAEAAWRRAMAEAHRAEAEAEGKE